MTYDQMKQLTAELMDDPQPGDCFNEMYSFFVKVVGRSGDWVISRETRGEDWGPPRLSTVDEFRRRFASGSGYWVLSQGNKARPDGIWDLDQLIAERVADLTRQSMEGASL